jgi:hypothetical protein
LLSVNANGEFEEYPWLNMDILETSMDISQIIFIVLLVLLIGLRPHRSHTPDNRGVAAVASVPFSAWSSDAGSWL